MKEPTVWLLVGIVFLLGFIEIRYVALSSRCRSKGGVLVQKIPFGTACVKLIP